MFENWGKEECAILKIIERNTSQYIFTICADKREEAAVAQWLRLELRCDRSQVRSPLYMSFRFGRVLESHHTNELALCWCLVSSSRVYCLLSSMNLPQGWALYNKINCKQIELLVSKSRRRSMLQNMKTIEQSIQSHMHQKYCKDFWVRYQSQILYRENTSWFQAKPIPVMRLLYEQSTVFD